VVVVGAWFLDIFWLKSMFMRVAEQRTEPGGCSFSAPLAGVEETVSLADCRWQFVLSVSFLPPCRVNDSLTQPCLQLRISAASR